jgi:hypothetical protein
MRIDSTQQGTAKMETFKINNETIAARSLTAAKMAYNQLTSHEAVKLKPESNRLLEKWCLDNLPTIQPLPVYNPPMRQVIQEREYGVVHVFKGGANYQNTIFDSHHTIHCYRAWHDTLHIKHDLPFGGDSEFLLAAIQETEALEMGICPRDAFLIKVDLICHIEHYNRHKRHPEYQARLILNYLNNGKKAFKTDYSEGVGYEKVQNL